jgi:NAD(P)-dependent dehydrogenase (short-subunit alcohol dehydrogenase family)
LRAQGDVRKADDCERWVREAVGRFGRLDILVNCAAGNFLVRLCCCAGAWVAVWRTSVTMHRVSSTACIAQQPALHLW